jgi:hypothetical protein
MAKVKIGNVYPSDDYLLDRCAPTGYGLGDSAPLLTSANDLNTICQSGWYRWGDSAPNNAPVIKRSNKYGYMRVDGSDEGTFTQTVYSVFGDARGLSVTRCITEGVVSEWEWVNPPMEIGVEYRTTEQWQGKPVYYKVVDFGGLPNATTAVVPIGVENIEWVFLDLSKSWAGPASDLTTNYLPNRANITEMFVSSGQISITTNADMTGTLAYIMVKYTKKTG